MKMAKRIMAAVCALGLVATMASAFVVARAEAVPTLKVTQTAYDPTTKIGTAKVSVVGLEDTITSGKKDYYFVELLQIGLGLSSDKFDASYYSSTGFVKPINTNVTIDARLKSKITGPGFAEDKLAATYADVDFMTNISNSALIGSSDNLSDIPFMTFNFKLKDGVDSAEITAGDVMIQAVIYNDDASAVIQTDKWGNMTGCATMEYAFDTLGSSATPTPTATATPTPTPVVTPEPTATVEPTPVAPTSGKGKVEIAEDAKDAAVWAWETAAVAGTKLAVTVTDGNEQRTKEFALNANVDATIKVGVIVQYDPTVYPLFDIVKVEVK